MSMIYGKKSCDEDQEIKRIQRSIGGYGPPTWM
jgi:hypothetical protein